MPWQPIGDVLTQTGPLNGKVVIDTTDQVTPGGPDELPEGLGAVTDEHPPDARSTPRDDLNTLTAGFQHEVAEGGVAGHVGLVP